MESVEILMVGVQSLILCVQTWILCNQVKISKEQNKTISTQTKYLIQKENPKIKILKKGFKKEGYFIMLENIGTLKAKNIGLEIEITLINLIQDENSKRIFKENKISQKIDKGYYKMVKIAKNYFNNQIELEAKEKKIFKLNQIKFELLERKNERNSLTLNFNQLYKKLIENHVNAMNLVFRLSYENVIGERILEKEEIERFLIKINGNEKDKNIEKIKKEKGLSIGQLITPEIIKYRDWVKVIEV